LIADLSVDLALSRLKLSMETSVRARYDNVMVRFPDAWRKR